MIRMFGTKPLQWKGRSWWCPSNKQYKPSTCRPRAADLGSKWDLESCFALQHVFPRFHYWGSRPALIKTSLYEIGSSTYYSSKEATRILHFSPPLWMECHIAGVSVCCTLTLPRQICRPSLAMNTHSAVCPAEGVPCKAGTLLLACFCSLDTQPYVSRVGPAVTLRLPWSKVPSGKKPQLIINQNTKKTRCLCANSPSHCEKSVCS